MNGYHVIWEMDIDADSPREAAEQARDNQTRPGTWAVVFDVTDPRTGKTTRVDLLGDEPGYKASGRSFDGLSASRRPPGWPEDDLLGQSVCAEHVPDYATGQQVPSDAPCVVCGEPSVMVLPKIVPDDKLRSDGEWPK